MCGRFTVIRIDEFVKSLPWVGLPDEPVAARYNIAPSQDVLVVPNTPQHKLEPFRWGLIPSWAKEPEIGNRMINARAEGVAQKPAFRTALRRRRCLVPADGFYEWQKNPDGKGKTPMYIRMKDGRPFAFAGLWDEWHDGDGSPVRSFTIITTEPNTLLAPIHNRMPVIVPVTECGRWAEPGELGPEALMDLLRPYPPEQMEAYPVARAVNNPKLDRPECIAPAVESADVRREKRQSGRETGSLFG